MKQLLPVHLHPFAAEHSIEIAALALRSALPRGSSCQPSPTPATVVAVVMSVAPLLPWTAPPCGLVSSRRKNLQDDSQRQAHNRDSRRNSSVAFPGA
ncbi:hypothetical protein ACNKHO_07535 [Shigella flexneri]